MRVLAKYLNGNVSVIILEDGTKIREWDETKPIEIEHPESIDVKITNYCDHGCLYCHENSNREGKHCDVSVLDNELSELPPGIELAIGGGNPLSHPDLSYLLGKLKTRGFISNITVNQKDLYIPKNYELLKSLIKRNLVCGIGVSISMSENIIDWKLAELQELSPNIVFHLIIGVNDIIDVDNLNKLKYCKILLLGYKHFGRGIQYHENNYDIDQNILNWKSHLSKYLNHVHLSFDNLAIEQLELQKILTKEQWDNFFMGQDFTFTMYIDAVKQEYAPTSRSSTRESFNNYTIKEYFQKFKNREI